MLDEAPLTEMTRLLDEAHRLLSRLRDAIGAAAGEPAIHGWCAGAGLGQGELPLTWSNGDPSCPRSQRST